MTRRQKEHAAKMRARRPVRPWDHAKGQESDRFRLSLRRLIHSGLSDEVIAQRLGVDKQVVWLLRNMNCQKSR